MTEWSLLTFTFISFDKLKQVLLLYLSIESVILPPLPYSQGEPMSNKQKERQKRLHLKTFVEVAYCL